MPVLDLEDYRIRIDLDQSWYRTKPEDLLTPGNQHELVLKLLEQITGQVPPDRWGTPHGARRTLYNMLIQANPGSYSEPELQAIDQLLWSEKQSESSRQSSRTLPKLDQKKNKTKLQIWRGDITTLACDAIVNAANSALLGCFRPDHPCIDNAIHAAAGPRLRDDCAAIMTLQGHPEPTGFAKITRAYNLPCRYVLHTVGPIHRGDDTIIQESHDLANAYLSCLNLAEKISTIKTLAFCCISTGVFGFPASRACQIAIKTVEQWLMNQPNHIQTIIFNVFSVHDEMLYQRMLGNTNDG